MAPTTNTYEISYISVILFMITLVILFLIFMMYQSMVKENAQDIWYREDVEQKKEMNKNLKELASILLEKKQS